MESVRTAPTASLAITEHIMQLQSQRRKRNAIIVDGILYTWTRYYDAVLVWDVSETLVGSALLELSDVWTLVDANGNFLEELHRDENPIEQIAQTIAANAQQNGRK